MEASKVVTCFLKYRDRILIARRSKEAGTYKRKWAGISGFIEGDENPIETAHREIKEETGIQRDKVVLLKRGKSFKVRDEKMGKMWIVHPFLFETMTEKIKLDREHKEYKWIKPSELSNYETVPQLEKSLHNVLSSDSP